MNVLIRQLYSGKKEVQIMKDHYYKKYFESVHTGLFTGEGGRTTSPPVCHRLAELMFQGGARGRHLTSRGGGCGHAWWPTSTPWLCERQIPLGEERVVVAVCRSKRAYLERTGLEEGLISRSALAILWLHVSSIFAPPPPPLSLAHRFNNTNHGDELRDATLAEKGSGLRLCLSSRRWAQNGPFLIPRDRPSIRVDVRTQDV